MPEIGEVRVGRELGYKSRARLIYAKCAACGKPRWVETKHGKPRYLFCLKCAIAREQATRRCIFCQRLIAPKQIQEVAIHGRYTTRQGVAHKACLNKYLTDVEFRKPHQNVGFMPSESYEPIG